MDHFYHLVAVYNLGADDTIQFASNIDRTGDSVELAKAIDAGHLRHVS